MFAVMALVEVKTMLVAELVSVVRFTVVEDVATAVVIFEITASGVELLADVMDLVVVIWVGMVPLTTVELLVVELLDVEASMLIVELSSGEVELLTAMF
jgi:hypothetical protein